MKSKIKAFTQKPFVRSVIVMGSGTVAAQAITMALSPIITRVYGPEAYGLMGVFMAIVGIIGPVAALTYPIAIVLPKHDRDAKELVKLSLSIAVGMAAIVALILLIFNQTIVSLFQLEDVASYLYLIPIVMILAGLHQVTEQWLIRTKQFGISAKVAFSHALLLQGGKAGIGFIYPSAAVLIVLSAIGDGVKALMMLFLARKSSYQSPVDEPEHAASMKELATKHKDFPIFRAPQVFINTISINIPVLLLTSFVGPAAAGFYTLGRTVLNIPSRLIGKSVGDVFYPRISEAANKKENLTALIKKATMALAAVGVVPFGLVTLIGPWLFSFVFGAEWVTAGEYGRWIALWIFFSFINQPAIRALPVLSAQAFHLKFTIVTLIVRTGALVGGYFLFLSDVMAIALFGIAGALLNCFLIGITLRISKKFDQERGV